MQRGFSRFRRGITRGIDKLSAKFRGLGGVATSALGVLGIAGGAIAAKRAIESVITTGAKLERTLVSAGVRFMEPALRGTKEFAELERAAKEAGATTEFTAVSAAGAIKFMALAGIDARQSIALLPGMIDLATASETELSRATDIATDSLGIFGLQVKDTVKLQSNVARVSDVLLKTTSTANVNLEQLFETLKLGGPNVRATGTSIETFAAIAGKLSVALKGSVAGIGIKNIFSRLARQTPQAAAALRHLGVTTVDSTGAIRDVFDVLEDLQKTLPAVGQAARSAALTDIFGERAVASVNILLATGADTLREYRRTLEGAGGTTGFMAKQIRADLIGAFDSLTSSVEGVGLQFFKMNREGLGEFVVSVRESVVAFGEFLDVNKEFAKTFNDDVLKMLKNGAIIFGGFIALILGMKTALLVAQVAMLAFNSVVLVLSISFKALMLIGTVVGFLRKLPVVLAVAGAAMKAFRVGVLALNLVLFANPIGLVIAAIGALIAIVVLVVRNWEPISKFFRDLWADVTESFSGAISFVKNLLETVSGPFSEFLDGFNGVRSAIGSAIVFGEVDSSSFTQAVKDAQRDSRKVETAWTDAGAAIKFFWEGIPRLVERLGQAIGVAIDEISLKIDQLTGAFERAGKNFEKVFGGGVVERRLDTLGGAFANLPGNLSNLFGLDDDDEDQPATGRPAPVGEVVTPAERVSRSITESSTTSNVRMTIADETGRARMPEGPAVPGVEFELLSSGGL